MLISNPSNKKSFNLTYKIMHMVEWFGFTTVQIIYYILLSILPYSVFAVAYWLKAKNYERWFIRKFIHVIGIMSVGLYSLLLFKIEAIIFVALLIGVIALALSFTPLNFIITTAKMTTRDGENWMETFVNFLSTFLAIVGLFYYLQNFPQYFRAIYLTSVAALAFGDGLAELIGRRYGKIQYRIFTKKTIEGSVTVLTASFISGVLIFSFFDVISAKVIWYLTISSFIAMVLEAVSLKFFDNLIIPWGVALYLVGVLGR